MLDPNDIKEWHEWSFDATVRFDGREITETVYREMWGGILFVNVNGGDYAVTEIKPGLYEVTQ